MDIHFEENRGVFPRNQVPSRAALALSYVSFHITPNISIWNNYFSAARIASVRRQNRETSPTTPMPQGRRCCERSTNTDTCPPLFDTCCFYSLLDLEETRRPRPQRKANYCLSKTICRLCRWRLSLRSFPFYYFSLCQSGERPIHLLVFLGACFYQ